MSNYKTPKGVTESQVEMPERYKSLEKRGITANLYRGNVVLKGGVYKTNILDEIVGKMNNDESVVLTIEGGPGTGKTYTAMALAQFLDKKFHINDTPSPKPEEDDGQLVFSREHLVHLIGENSPIKRGQVVVMDEGHFGIGSRSWHSQDQQELVNLLAAIRSQGYVLILVVLHNTMVDKIIRDFVTNYSFNMIARGVAVAYRRSFPVFSTHTYVKRLGTLIMPLPDEHLCNKGSCLRCSHLKKKEDERCETMVAIYERRKMEFLEMKAKSISDRMGVEKKKNISHGFDSIEQLFLDHPEDRRYIKRNGRLDQTCLIDMAAKHLDGFHLGMTRSNQFRNKLEEKYPEESKAQP